MLAPYLSHKNTLQKPDSVQTSGVPTEAEHAQSLKKNSQSGYEIRGQVFHTDTAFNPTIGSYQRDDEELPPKRERIFKEDDTNDCVALMSSTMLAPYQTQARLPFETFAERGRAQKRLQRGGDDECEPWHLLTIEIF